ncbi:MAG: hypothetical protein ACYSR9_05030, partial [Planctomycetota bacterium]
MENVFDSQSSGSGWAMDEKLLTNWRILFVEFAFQLGSFLLNVRSTGMQQQHLKELSAILDQCVKMSRIPDQEGKIVIRFRGRGIPGESGESEKYDYVFRYGNIEIDVPLIKKVAKRGGVTTSHLPWRLLKSFENFAALDINTLFFDIGTCQDEEQVNLRRSLEIIGNYFHVLEFGSEQAAGQEDMPTLIYDEISKPDPNLTLLAAYNKVPAKAIQDVVANISQRMQQADSDSPLAKCSSVFDAIFHFKKLREQLKRPPLEVNNAKWLLVSEGEQVVTAEDVPLSKEVLGRLLDMPHKASQILATTYGDELLGFNAKEVGGWLGQVCDLLQIAKDEGGEELVVADIMYFIQKSLDHVADDVLESLVVEGNEVVTEIEDGKKLRIQISEELGKQLLYYKKRAHTRCKMQNLLNKQVSFTDDDFAVIAEDFAITIEDAKELLILLQSSFDQDGHFQRKVFEINLKEFAKYERNIFQFLWHYLKQIDNRQDRVSYLNSLQLLIAEMKDPKQALLVLLADFIKTPMQVSFFDRNALILATILLRKYNQELRNEIEITPEEVLMVREGLDPDRVAVAVEQVSMHQEKFYQKIRLIHEGFQQALNPRAVATKTLPIRYLVTLEREAYIFLSLIGGTAAHKIIRDATEEFGNPHAKIYMLEKSSENVPAIMQLFKVIIRGLHRFNDVSDLPILQSVLEQEKAL